MNKYGEPVHCRQKSLPIGELAVSTRKHHLSLAFPWAKLHPEMMPVDAIGSVSKSNAWTESVSRAAVVGRQQVQIIIVHQRASVSSRQFGHSIWRSVVCEIFHSASPKKVCRQELKCQRYCHYPKTLSTLSPKYLWI